MNELVNRRERWFSVAIGLELTMLFFFNFAVTDFQSVTTVHITAFITVSLSFWLCIPSLHDFGATH